MPFCELLVSEREDLRSWCCSALSLCNLPALSSACLAIFRSGDIFSVSVKSLSQSVIILDCLSSLHKLLLRNADQKLVRFSFKTNSVHSRITDFLQIDVTPVILFCLFCFKTKWQPIRSSVLHIFACQMTLDLKKKGKRASQIVYGL